MSAQAYRRSDIFFDDSQLNIANARRHVAAGHVPHGVSNPAGD